MLSIRWGDTIIFDLGIKKKRKHHISEFFFCEFRTSCKTSNNILITPYTSLQSIKSKYQGSKINQTVFVFNTMQHVLGRGDNISPFSIQTNEGNLRPTRSITPHTAELWRTISLVHHTEGPVSLSPIQVAKLQKSESTDRLYSCSRRVLTTFMVWYQWPR